MKKQIFLLLISFLLPLSLFAQQKEMPSKWKADIDYMQPLKYGSRSVSDFGFTIQGDTASICLPYMGEVFMPSMHTDGLNFKAPMQKIQRGYTKKGDHVLLFELRHTNIVYSFRITAYRNGKLDLHLYPSNAQPCSYIGTWEGL